MKTLPTEGSTVYLIVNGDYVRPYLVLYVTHQLYIQGTETNVPVERQVAFCAKSGPVERGYEIIEVPKLFATEREARLVLVQILRAWMNKASLAFDDAYRAMIADEKTEAKKEP